MHIVTVVGARPQFVKAAPFSRALRQQHTEYLIHTGQHYDENMSHVFFDELGIPKPDINLGVGSSSHAVQTAQMMIPIEEILLDQKPDWLVLYGDTNSTLAGAIAASKLNIRIAHIEAGLRNFDRTMPEEVNRLLTDHLSELLFCPTPVAVDNLNNEGITAGVVMTGDIMADVLLQNIEIARQKSQVHPTVGIDPNSPYLAMTIHRPANTDDPVILTAILETLNQLEMPVVFPVHPRTRKAMEAVTITLADHVHLIEPLSYLDMLALVDQAAVLMTDSGGLQKESYILETPCITVYDSTSWVETVESGWNQLVPADTANLLAAIQQAQQHRPAAHPDLYGDGHAAERMVSALTSA